MIFENFDGKSNLKNFVENQERYKSILDNPLSKQEQICLVEAALIRYFQPKFNKIYKENFPSFKYKVLEQCYSLDFSGLAVEINTEELDIRLYSDNIIANTHHISKINLIEHEDRYSFFHFTLDSNSPAYIPQDVIS
jgi:hypothetical protein